MRITEVLMLVFLMCVAGSVVSCTYREATRPAPVFIDKVKNMALCTSAARGQMLSYTDGEVTLTESGGKQTTIYEAADMYQWMAYQGKPENGAFECSVVKARY